MPTGSPIVETTCLSREGELPHGLARIYMPRDLVPAGVLGDDPRAARQSQDSSSSARRRPLSERRCALGPPTSDEALALRIGHASVVLSVTRIATDSTGRVAEATLLAFPGERVEAVFTTHYVIDGRQTQG